MPGMECTRVPPALVSVIDVVVTSVHRRNTLNGAVLVCLRCVCLVHLLPNCLPPHSFTPSLLSPSLPHTLTPSLPLPPLSPSLLADPRRPYPQDIEMRSGFLGGVSPPDPQENFASDSAPSTEPPEKKIALETKSVISLQGVCVCVCVVCSV